MVLWGFDLPQIAAIAVPGMAVLIASFFFQRRRRLTSELGRGTLSAAIVLTFAGVPPAVQSLVMLRASLYRDLGMKWYAIHVSPLPGWIALVAAVAVFALARPFHRPELLYLTCFSFALLNSVWRGVPGFFGSKGFPLSWYSYSDAIININGQNYPPSPVSFLAGAFDAVVLSTVIAALFVKDLRVAARLHKSTPQCTAPNVTA